MFTAAVFEEKALGIYWFSAEESCGEKKIRPHTITSEISFVVGTGKWETEKEKRGGMLSLIMGFLQKLKKKKKEIQHFTALQS